MQVAANIALLTKFHQKNTLHLTCHFLFADSELSWRGAPRLDIREQMPTMKLRCKTVNSIDSWARIIELLLLSCCAHSFYCKRIKKDQGALHTWHIPLLETEKSWSTEGNKWKIDADLIQNNKAWGPAGNHHTTQYFLCYTLLFSSSQHSTQCKQGNNEQNWDFDWFLKICFFVFLCLAHCVLVASILVPQITATCMKLFFLFWHWMCFLILTEPKSSISCLQSLIFSLSILFSLSVNP